MFARVNTIGQSRHPLEIVIWSNEEGGTVGRRATLHDVKPEDLDRLYYGVPMADGLAGPCRQFDLTVVTPGDG